MVGKFLIYALLSCGSYVSVHAEEFADTAVSRELEEFVVEGQSARRRIDNKILGVENIELDKMARMPMLFGENDIIKSISLLPGVHGEGDGAGGFEVRGGTSSQNLISLDGITLYNPTHVMGIFSTFNDNAIGHASLFKGPIPACYGGATSAVLETGLAPGNMNSYHGSATIGILAAKLKAEGPILKNKLSFAVSARRSYVDAFLQVVPEYRSTVMNFYDVTAKLRYIPGRDDIIDLSFICSHDNMAIKKIMGMYWGNIGGSLNWQKRLGDRWTFTTTAAATSYDPDMKMTMLNTDQRLTEYIRNFSLNEKAVLEITSGHKIEFGLRSEFLKVKSADMVRNDSHNREIRSGWQNSVWGNYDAQFNSKMELSAGVRLSLFSVVSGKHFNAFYAPDETMPDFSSRTYFDVEPRISFKYNINPLNNLKLGFGITTQNIHAIRSNSTSFPFDRYALTSANVKPEKCNQYGMGYSGMTENGIFDWSAEVYYKNMNNVYDYQDGKSMFSRINLESIILGGKGRSYGGEIMFRKNSGRLTGWVAYTLSWTKVKIPGINNGLWYDASNDRRHNVSVAAIFKINDRWDISGTWIYSSGQPLTAPDAKYQLDGTTCYYYSKINGYKTPATHRLDLSAVYTRKGKRFTSQLAFGVYNAYCRYNPYVVYFEDDPTKPSGTRTVMQALFGIIPSVSYTISL